MDKAAREAVQWEVESVLDAELPDLASVSEAVQKAVQRELVDSLSPLFSVNDLAETIMGKVLELLDYDEALSLLKDSISFDHGPDLETIEKIQAFLANHGIEVDDV